MRLENSFAVPVPADLVYETLLDMRRVASCMPGAEITGQDGETYQGQMAVKVGPISTLYSGELVIKSADKESRSAVLIGRGKESNGQGSAEVAVEARVEEVGEKARVTIETDLQIQGKAAQFGRGVITTVSARIVEQFANNLEAMLLDERTGPIGAKTEAEQLSRQEQEAPAQKEQFDALGDMVVPLIREHVGVGLFCAGILGMILGWLIGKRSSSRPHGAQYVAYPQPQFPMWDGAARPESYARSNG